MARIRSIKPEYWSDEKVAELPRVVRLTLLGLISAMADDDGRCKGNPRVVRAAVYPLDDDITAAEVEQHLEAIAAQGIIERYTVNGEHYIQLVHWSRHQRIDRPTPSRLPAPPSAAESRRALDEDSSSPPRALDADKEGRGVEGSRESSSRSSEVRSTSEDRDLDRESAGAGGPAASPAAPSPRGAPAAQGERRNGHGSAPPGTPRGSAPKPSPKQPPLNIAPIESHLPRGACQLLIACYGVQPGTRLCDLAPRPLQVARDMTRTLSRRGAMLRRGVFVRAFDPLHLSTTCQVVAEHPPRDRDAAWPLVLTRLQETWTDTVAERERRSAVRDHAERRALLEQARQWAAEHPDDWEPRAAKVQRDVAAQYRGELTSPMGQAFLQPVLESALVAAYQEYLSAGEDDAAPAPPARAAGSGG